MFALRDVVNIESDSDISELEYYSSMQRAINSGMWGLQGSYGRSMMEAIGSGCCLLGESSARDYYGNYIPSRDKVKEGTKGSITFVESQMGADWLAAMEAV